MNGATVYIAAIGYVGILFLIAWWGDRGGRRFIAGGSRAVVYALSLAVYCTSWTYYGSVGLASSRGLDFLPIYIGPALVIGLGSAFVWRIANLARTQNLTTVADFVSARYGKSPAVAAIAALVALVGSAPYVALQLKAVSTTLLTVVASFDTSRLTADTPTAPFSLAIALVLAAFAIAFGTRRINPKEHQDGLILAIAVEAVVKLGAFLAVGVFVVWGMNGGLSGLTHAVQTHPKIAAVIQTAPDPAVWGVTTLLSAFAILLLPRQFHVAVVENHDRRGVRTASWMFPAYLVLINLFVAPLAIAGLKMFPDGAINRDLTVLALPLAAGARGLALLTVIGGLSAATGMVVLDSLALAITVSNDLVMPLLLRRRLNQTQAAEGDIGALVLWVRRLSIVGVLMLGLLYELMTGETALVSIGLLSFAALAQIAPAFLGGLFLAPRHGARRDRRHGDRLFGLAVHSVSAVARTAQGHRDLSLRRAAGDRLAQSGWARSLRAKPSGRRRRHFSSRQRDSICRILADPRRHGARARAGQRLRRRRRQAAGLPAVALVDNGRRTRSRGRPLSRRGAGAAGVFRLHARERPGLRSNPGSERAAHPPGRIPALARHRSLDLASGSFPAVAAADRLRPLGAEADRRGVRSDPVEPRPVAARPRPCPSGHHGVRLQSRSDRLEPRVRRVVRPAASPTASRRRARRDRPLQRRPRRLWTGRFGRLRRRAGRLAPLR